MAIKLKPKTQTTTSEHRVMAFQVNTLPNQPLNFNVYYGSVLYGETGNILSTTPNIATLTLTENQLTGLLPSNNKYKLPHFKELHDGLISFFDDQFNAHFSGLFPN